MVSRHADFLPYSGFFADPDARPACKLHGFILLVSLFFKMDVQHKGTPFCDVFATKCGGNCWIEEAQLIVKLSRQITCLLSFHCPLHLVV